MQLDITDQWGLLHHSLSTTEGSILGYQSSEVSVSKSEEVLDTFLFLLVVREVDLCIALHTVVSCRKVCQNIYVLTK